MKNYYEILGVDKDATTDEIKKAYRQIALKYHPDKNPGDKEAEERFKEAAEAYSILGNSTKKAEYDRGGTKVGGDSWGFMGDIFNMFGDIFGGGMDRESDRDIRTHIDITVEEAIKGGKKSIKITKASSCPDCHGTGGFGKTVCSECRGKGFVIKGNHGFIQRMKCPKCNGLGSILSSPCKTCGSMGVVMKDEELTVDIKPGTLGGTMYRYRGAGSAPFRGEGVPGDLHVHVNVKSDIFGIDGRDVHYLLKISLKTALLGDTIKVPLPGGGDKEVVLESPTQCGKVFGMRGGGIAGGVFYVHIEVEMPKLNDNQKRIIDETL